MKHRFALAVCCKNVRSYRFT